MGSVPQVQTMVVAQAMEEAGGAMAAVQATVTMEEDSEDMTTTMMEETLEVEFVNNESHLSLTF